MVKVPKSIKTEAQLTRWLLFVQDRTNELHGTVEGYDRKVCRCNRCRLANSVRYRERVRDEYAARGEVEWWRDD